MPTTRRRCRWSTQPTSSPSATDPATLTPVPRSRTCTTPSTRPRRSTGCPMHDPFGDGLSETDWSTWTIEQMWAALGDFDQQRAIQQAPGWAAAFELLEQHQSRLLEYRDAVAQTWQGTAAAAF